MLSVHRLSLFTRLFAAFAFVVGVALTVEAWLVIRVGEVALDNLVVENLTARVRERFKTVNEFLADRASEIRTWSGLSVMDDVLVQDRVLSIENFLLERRREQSDVYVSLAVLDRSGTVIASSDVRALGSALDVTALTPLVEAGGTTRWSGLPAESAATSAAIDIAQPIVSRLSTEPIGWIVGRVRWDEFERLIAASRKGVQGDDNGTFFLLVNADGAIVAGNRSRAAAAGWPSIDRAYLTVESNGQPGFAAPVRGARFVGVWDRSDAFRVDPVFVAVVLTSTFLCVLIAAAVSYAIARYITTRLRKLVEGTGVVGRGDLSYRVDEGPDDEFGELARAFNQMGSELARARDALEGTLARWKALVTHAPDLILTVDRAGTILFVNRVVPGLSVEEVIGTGVDRYVAPQFVTALHTAIERVFVTAEPESLELEGTGPDRSTAWYSSRIGPVLRDAAVVAATIITTDITERRRLEREVLDIAESERARIGRDLHDSLGQSLTGTALLSKGLQQQLEATAPEHAEQARRISALIDETIGATRVLAQGLSPAALLRTGLSGALEDLVSGIQRMHGATCRIKVAEDAAPDDRSQATQLFRITQEALNNALRHGQATRIAILLSRRTTGRLLMIRDNGAGFRSDQATGEGLGLRSMRHRAGLLGGTLEIRSSPGKGTCVVCRFP